MAGLMAGAAAAFKGAGALGTIAKVASIGGTILSARAAAQQGAAQEAAARATAQQLERQAMTERASAQRAADEERRKKDYAISRARAVAAASGGGQDLSFLGDLEEEGEYNALVAEWEGEERAKGRRAQAAAERFQGKQYARAGRLNAMNTILAGATNYYDRYGNPSMADKYGVA